MGAHLAGGRDLLSPTIVWAGSRAFVLFNQGTEPTELYRVPFDGMGPAAFLDTRFSRYAQTSRSGYLVIDDSPTVSVFDLESASLVGSVSGSFEQLQADNLLISSTLEQSIVHSLVPLPNGIGTDVGELLQSWLAPSGRLYFLKKDGTFASFEPSSGLLQESSQLVKTFLVSPDERFVVIQELHNSLPGKPDPTAYRLLDRSGKSERGILPLHNPYCWTCDWLGFSPDSQRFYYAENSPQDPGLIYQVEAETNQVLSVQTRPGPQADTLLWNPAGDFALVGERACGIEDNGCQAQYRSTLQIDPLLQPISTGMTHATLSADGRYVLFRDALKGGRLLVASTTSLSPDPSASAELLWPEGSEVDGSTFDTTTATAIFWARPEVPTVISVSYTPRGNLYAASAPEFRVRRLAEAADAVAIGPGLAVALVRVSAQDLTGELVLYDLGSGHERTLAAPVSSFWATLACPNPGPPAPKARWQLLGSEPPQSTEMVAPPGCPADSPLLVVFTVRGRVKSDKDGLWALTIQP